MGRLTEIANQIESPGATSEAGIVTMPSGETVAIKPAPHAVEDALAIPDFCKMSPEARKAAWAAYDLKNPKPVAATTETTKMKPKTTGKADQLRAMREAEAAKREAEAKAENKKTTKKMATAASASDTPTTPSTPEDDPKAVKQESEMSTRKTKTATKAKARNAVKGKTKAKAPKKANAAKAEKTARSGSKTEAIKSLLSRAAGCTAAEVMEATGWPSVSMPQQARNLGIKLKTEKEGRVTRYWAA